MITVIITTCKRKPNIINRAIYSVIEQTYKEWELIVIDDSPNDWPLRIEVGNTVKKYADSYNIKYIPNERNCGACYSRNIGLQRAKGEYIAYLDDDDEWLPEKLEKQLYALDRATEDTALVYGPYYKLVEKTGEKTLVECPLLTGKLYEELMQKGNFMGGMSMPLMRTKSVIDVGGFDELMQSAQDMDLWLRLTKKFNVISISCPLVIYHIYDGEQITNNPQKKLAGLQRLNEKNRSFLLKNRTVYWKRVGLLIPYLIQLGNKKKAYRIWIHTVCLCPYKFIPNLINLVKIILSKY